MPHDPNVQRALSRLARTKRHLGTDPAEVEAARAALAEVKIQSVIERETAKAPPLSGEQRARLARLLVIEGQRASYAASAAARSASRAFVTAPDQATAYARAGAAARLAFGDQGIGSADFTLTVTCRPDPRHCLTPGSVVSAEVRSAADLPLMPSALGGNTPRIAVAAVHRSPYGTFREARP